ncbi:VOC family protein [Microbulbifer harenosus]|uniref:VOC family protein n=1 Tax=Microbulbifer harenosus TaxID=2576840 RepID=A0ABY2UNT9_9GAMM|nr:MULTISPECIES: VOC family protein [Microbulbifer]QIL91010.1 VOC family protein [Microbulbifer sp. SH-1]TLM79231.1 VOC family protein [Microbulbifer harenosus]
MLDHIGLIVHDYQRSKAFYQSALAPLGYELVMEMGDWAGFGWGDKPQLLIKGGSSTAPAVHIAFSAEDRETVRAFYDAALKAGGKDSGAPGLRPEYHDHYYAAYVLDPDGHKIEVVCHIPADAF